MKKIIILDFSTSQIHVFSYDESVYENYEDFYVALEEQGYYFTDSNCQCMIQDELNITIH